MIILPGNFVFLCCSFQNQTIVHGLWRACDTLKRNNDQDRQAMRTSTCERRVGLNDHATVDITQQKTPEVPHRCSEFLRTQLLKVITDVYAGL